MEFSWTIILAFVFIAVLAVVAVFLSKPVQSRVRRREAVRGVRDFRFQREQLEAKFFDMARTSGKPVGLRWIDCEWLDTTTFARDLKTQLLTAFVAVNISFEAIEDEDMVDVEAVGLVREATAVFHYHRGRWGTGGKALFNMDPVSAVTRLAGQFERIANSETSQPSL